MNPGDEAGNAAPKESFASVQFLVAELRSAQKRAARKNRRFSVN
jgi:hypothetical protein